MAGGPVVGGLNKRYNGRSTFYIYFVVILGACAGLLLGYDNGVIGGVTAMADFQLKFFEDTLYAHNHPAEYLAMNPGQGVEAAQQAQLADQEAASPYCKYDDQILQLVVSSLYLAAAATSVFAAHWARKFGRKPMLFISGVLFCVGAGLQGGAVDVGMLVAGRVVLGLGVGIASLVGPVYNAEMAPAHLRGAMNVLFQLAVTIGILAAGLINYGCEHLHPWGWRLSLALAAVPGALIALGGIVLPDSPVSYIERGHMEKAHKVLVRIRGVDNVDEEFQDIIEAARLSSQIKHPWRNLFKSQYRPQLIISLLFMLFQQFTGINAIIFYAPILFSSIGSSDTTSLINTVIIGAVNVLATLVAVFLVDRLGRKFLLIQGGVQMIIAEIVVGVTLKKEFEKASSSRLANIAAGLVSADSPLVVPDAVAIGVLVVICVFIAGFAWSWGPIGWLYPTEIQPLETRTAGASINTASNMIFTFVIGQSFVTMLCSMEWGVFLFFAGFVITMTLWTIFLLPETKGKDLENTFRTFQTHPFWSKFSRVNDIHHNELPRISEEGANPKQADAPMAEEMPNPKVINQAFLLMLTKLSKAISAWVSLGQA
ncbi:hypothetical protein WJX73_010313 [Symbiochloris irregularis]|uniref:Major facilitator superfamily (MFS) profile domain-containing protein n=1 Tax=Symbiochloris irregularis TaxID=706552 RepID=A0AAW1PWJ1_9CHLO